MFSFPRVAHRLIFGLVLVVSNAVFAQSPPPASQLLQPPELAARSYLLLDVTANQILAAKDIDLPIEPASLTKLMTEYLVFDALRAKKLTSNRPCPSVSGPGKCLARACSLTPKCRCRLKI